MINYNEVPDQEPTEEDIFFEQIEQAKLFINGEGTLKPSLEFFETETDRQDKIDFEKNRLKGSSPISNVNHVISFNGKSLAFPKEVLLIAGLPGDGKTGADQMIIAKTLSLNADGCDGIEVEENINGWALLHFESEQSPKRQIETIRKNNKRAGIIGDGPEWYCSFSMLEEIDTMLEDVEKKCETAYKIFKGIHSIHVDGAAECCLNTQELEPSRDAMKRLKRLGEKYSCVVVLIIHTNPGITAPAKARGHFGSEAERMCASELIISQDENGISTITPKKVRHTGKKDFPCIQFRFDEEKNYHVTTGAVKRVSSKEKKELAEAANESEILTKVFPFGKNLKYEDALEEITETRGCKKDTAKRIFAKLNKENKIVKANGFWHIKTATV